MKNQPLILNILDMIFTRLFFTISTFAILLNVNFCFGQQANVNLDFNPQKDTEGLIPFSAQVNSPEVHDDQTVTFRLMAPEAQKVELNPGAINTALGMGSCLLYTSPSPRDGL